MKPTIQEIQIALIEKTGNPMAPLIMDKLACALDNAKVLFPCVEADVETCQVRLLKDFKDTELNQLASESVFITSLMILLITSLGGFVSKP